MLRITRDKAELGDVPFITFTVQRSPRDKTVCGTHEFDQHSLQKSFDFMQLFTVSQWRKLSRKPALCKVDGHLDHLDR